MKLRPIIATLLAGSTLALAACGTPREDRPAAQPPVPSVDQAHARAWQAYYDATHPPQSAGDDVAVAEAWQVYYEVTHPRPIPHPGGRP
jgi:hypothetical protein